MSVNDLVFDLPLDADARKMAAAQLTVAVCALMESKKTPAKAMKFAHGVYEAILAKDPEHAREAMKSLRGTDILKPRKRS
ncbi:MAG: hypothetical protein FWH34_05585 [Desulfovibrionaceae bacterium]|nr:hypothetical protein [Desulfovibrionaceae bacterium]